MAGVQSHKDGVKVPEEDVMPLGILSEATKEAGLELLMGDPDGEEENEDDHRHEDASNNIHINNNGTCEVHGNGAIMVRSAQHSGGAGDVHSSNNIYELAMSLEADADRLTDSNSSEKMSPPHDADTDDLTLTDLNSMDTCTESVPINFPIRGRILARLRLQGKGCEYFMTKSKLVIGRHSSKGAVDIDIGNSSFISRNHLTIVHETDEFYLSCGGKNGVFVDDTFQKIGAPRTKLPQSCALRFPSTQIIISFDAAKIFINQYSISTPRAMETCDYTAAESKSMKALSVQIPEDGSGSREEKPKKPFNRFFSPCPSPSGTMSAVNSCPTSPTNALVYSKKAVVAADAAPPHRYVSNPAPVKDSRVPLFDEDLSKPPFSYAQLIVQAISNTQDKQMTLSGIYAYISRNYQYYRANDRGWQNSIRHNLSLNRYFIKVARTLDEPGKGCFWSIDPVSEPKLVAQAFRRRNKRGVPYFRGTAGNLSSLTTQSCPASPLNVAFYPDSNSVTSISTAAPPSNIVTIATVNSVAEAITMQSKFSQVIDIKRAIQSAPGSPQGYKVLSPASLIAAKVLPKGGTASVIGSKPSGITLLQPIKSLISIPTSITGKPRRQASVLTLSSQQAQMLRSGTLLSGIPTVPVTVPVTSHPASAAGTAITVTTAQATPFLDTVNAIVPNHQEMVSGGSNKRSIFVQFASPSLLTSLQSADAAAQTLAKISKTEGS